MDSIDEDHQVPINYKRVDMKILIIFFLIFTIQVVYPQGEYLERGNDAYEIGASLGYHPKLYGLSVAGSFTIASILDMGLSYSLNFSKEKQGNIDPTSNAISIFLKVHIIKQSVKFPFSISGFAQYQKNTFSSESNDQLLSLHFSDFGGSLFHSIRVSEQLSIQPSFAYFLTYLINVDATDQEFETIGLSVPFVIKADDKRTVINPSVAFTESETAYSLSFSYIGITSSN